MNLYLRYFDNETLVTNVDDAISFLADIDEIGMNPMLEEDIREYMEFQKADYEASGLEYKLNIETAAKAEWKRDALGYQDIYKNTLTPFLEKCGNYRLISIGGDHGLFFAQKPDEVANEILNFLAETTE